MQIANNCVVTLAYILKDNDDNVIDKSEDGSFCYLHGAANIIPGLENALTGKAAGDEFSVSVSPEDGYGEHNPDMKQEVPREMFPAEQEIMPGMQFHAQSPEGHQIVVTVAEVKDSNVVVDGNHPLAGVALNFDVKVMEIREASAEEIEHGHVHGPHGHDHG